MGGKCSVCGEQHLVNLVFHHIDPSNKKFTIGRNLNLRLSVLRKEAEKCVVMCRNCHREEHSSKEPGVHKKRKIKALEYKKTTSCVRCGYSRNTDSLDFHHLDRNSKELEFRNVRFDSNKEIPTLIKEELDKCIVLCSNCHAEEHASYDITLKADNKHKIKEQRVISTEKIINLSLEGLRPNEICKKLDLPKSTVSTILKRNGINSFVSVDSNIIIKYSTSLTIKEIHELTGYCKSSISKVLKFNNIKPLKKYKNKLKISLSELKKLREEGKTFREIGDMYRVSLISVRNKAIKYGIHENKKSPN